MTTTNHVLLLTLICWGALPAQPAKAELRRLTGDFVGVYHQDRWGVGNFNGYLVAPKLHERLKEHEGNLIRVDVEKSLQFSSPGPVFIQEIGEIVTLPLPKLKIDLRAWPNKAASSLADETCLLIKLINESENPVEVSLNSLTLARSYIRSAAVNGDAPSHLFPEYTRRQLSVRRRSWWQGWGSGRGNSPINHSPSNAVIPIGTGIKIAPGQEFPVVPSPTRLGAEWEIAVSLRSSNPEESAIAWFRTDELQAPSTSEEHSKLVFNDIEISKEVSGLFWLRLTLHAEGQGKRYVVASPCKPQTSTGRKRFKIAGKLFALQKDDNSVAVRARPLGDYDGPTELSKVHSEGMHAEFYIREPLSKRYRYDVLTQRGLESVWFELPDFKD